MLQLRWKDYDEWSLKGRQHVTGMEIICSLAMLDQLQVVLSGGIHDTRKLPSDESLTVCPNPEPK